MIEITDCFGRKVRLTDECLARILERSEMRGMRDRIVLTCKLQPR